MSPKMNTLAWLYMGDYFQGMGNIHLLTANFFLFFSNFWHVLGNCIAKTVFFDIVYSSCYFKNALQWDFIFHMAIKRDVQQDEDAPLLRNNYK